MLYTFHLSDLLPYIMLYILCLYAALKNNRLIFKLTFIFVFLFTAIRYGIGYDYFNYVERIKGFDAKDFSFFEYMSGLIYIISQKTSPQFFFIINSFVCLYPIYFTSKKYSPKPALVFFAFIMIPLFYLESLSIVRYSSAVSLFILSFYYLDRKKYFKYILCCILAGGFHTAGYLAFTLIFIKLVKSNYFVNLILYILSILFLLFPVDNLISLIPAGNNLIYLKLLRYSSETESGGMMTIVLFSIGLVNLIFWKKLVEFKPINILYLLHYNLGLLLWGLLSFNNTLSLRVGTFFLLFIIFIVPSYILIFERKNKLISSIVLYSFLSIFFASSFVINIANYKPSFYDRLSTLPYQTIFYNKDYQNYKYRYQWREAPL